MRQSRVDDPCLCTKSHSLLEGQGLLTSGDEGSDFRVYFYRGVRNQTSWFTFREGRRGYDGRVYLEVMHQGLLMGVVVVDGEGVTVGFTCQ